MGIKRNAKLFRESRMGYCLYNISLFNMGFKQKSAHMYPWQNNTYKYKSIRLWQKQEKSVGQCKNDK